MGPQPRPTALGLLTAALAAGGLVLAVGDASAQPPPRAPRGPGYHGVTVPTQPSTAKKVDVLLDTPHLKLVAISLPRGTGLEKHTAPSAVTIQALTGSGMVKIGSAEERLSESHMVYLAPGVEHSVAPDEGKDLMILVHHAKRMGPAGRGVGPMWGPRQ